MAEKGYQYNLAGSGLPLQLYAFQDPVLEVWTAEECFIFLIQNITADIYMYTSLFFLTSWHATTLVTFCSISAAFC